MQCNVTQHYKATKFHCKKYSKSYEYRLSLYQHVKIAHKRELLQCIILFHVQKHTKVEVP